MSLKEYIICDNEHGRIWRVSKKLRKIKSGSGFRFVAKVLHLHIFKDRFILKWSNVSETTTEKRRESFKITKNKIVPYRKAGGKHVYTYKPIMGINDLKKCTYMKINRILNKEYGFKFKIGVPTYLNMLKHSLPTYAPLYEKPDMSMACVMKRASVKESIRAYCGFGGKKLISTLLQYPEHEQKQKLDVIKFMRKYLTFGEIDIARIRYFNAGSTVLKEFLDKNPTLFKKFLMQNPPVLPVKEKRDPLDPTEVLYQSPSWLLSDTIHLYQTISATDIDLESTDLAFSRAKDLQKYHDALAVFQRKLRDKKVDFQQWDFDGSKIGDFTLEVCKDSHQLIEWGTYMGNCVTSYRNRIVNNEMIMCGLFKDDKLVYNLSFHIMPNGKIRIDQLNCRYNKGYDKGDLALVETFITEQNHVLSRQKKTVNP